MREVAAQLNESCSAAVLSDEDVVYVARVPGERNMSVALHVGTRLPAWCTSMGRVLLSDLGDAQLGNSSTGSDRAGRRKRQSSTGAASRPDRKAAAAGLCHRRRGAGDRPALDRRADPRPFRRDRRGDQRLDAVLPLHRRRDEARDPAAAEARQARSRIFSSCSKPLRLAPRAKRLGRRCLPPRTPDQTMRATTAPTTRMPMARSGR